MKSSYFLGIFGGHGPNPAAALICNNKLIAFAEEERFNRIKNAPSYLPIRSILFCLKKANIDAKDLNSISLGHGTRNVTVQIDKHNFTRNLSMEGFESIC